MGNTRKYLLFIYIITLYGCHNYQDRQRVFEPNDSSSVRVSHENLNGILWMQSSAEYDSLCWMI
jgi:hypothetical protein